jgi:Xaa-Pro aminopeptidase
MFCYMPALPSNPQKRSRRGTSDSASLAVLLSTLLLLSPALLSAQVETRDTEVTPEQRYGDWVRRLDFRPQEYSFRRSNMIQLLRESGGGLFLAPSSDGVTNGSTFRQLDDFWYYTGLEVPNSMLVLDADRDRAILFLPQTDYRFESEGRPNDFPGRQLLDDYQLRSIGGIDEYRDMAELERYLGQRVRSRTLLRVNGGSPEPIRTPDIPMFGSLGPRETMLLKIRSDYPDARIQNAYEEVARGRMVKSRNEIQRMQIAAEATTQAIQYAASLIRTGVDERSIQGEFEATCRALGSQSIPFTPIVKSGPNSLWPWRVLASHYDRRNRPMEADELVILDVGCELGGYISDVGRTFPVGGTFTALQREKLMVSTNAADAIIAAIRPGITMRELLVIAYEAIPDDEEQYMQTSSFFGHHIGLAANDPALLDEPLAAGMVFTVEPWYYNHDLNIAVFVEDVVVVTEDGAEVLTRFLARTPEALEALIR